MATVAIAVISLASCNKNNNPVIQFDKTLYTVYEGGEVVIGITVSEPSDADILVPLRFNDGPVKNVDYTVSSETVTIPAGQTVGYVTLTNISMTVEKPLAMSFELPAGYSYGLRLLAIVNPDSQEAIVYQFATDKTYANESVIATIKVTGSVSGSDLVTPEDLYIPLVLEGEGSSALTFVPENSSSAAQPESEVYALLRAGETKATVRFTVADGFSGDLNAVLSVDNSEDNRFIAGDNSTLSINVRGLQTPDKLLGTWVFSKVYDLDEVEEWFAEMEDDTELLPTHNEGFTLTFAQDSNGEVTVTPGGTGDMLNFFRTATVSLTEPKNTVSGSVTLGKYTVYESNMFIADVAETYQTNTYYQLSSANRAFSSSDESLGEAVVVFSLTDNGLNVEFRDYDTPPFGEMWWDGGGFDPEVFGFASLFVRK